MPKSLEDRVEDRVRSRLKERLAAAGVCESEVALEILYLLPTEFVRMYQQLWDLCFGEQRSPGSYGGDEGRLKRSGNAVGKGSQMKTRKMSGASGTGKRWSAPREQIRNEEAVTAKGRLDRKLVRAVEAALRDSRVEASERPAGAGTGSPIGAAASGSGKANFAVMDGKDQIGHIGHSSKKAQGLDSDRNPRRCSECGSFQAGGWKRCPFHP